MTDKINIRFKHLRVKLRLHGINIAEDVYHRFHPATKNPGCEICVFCFSSSKITKEHVLPKWVFEKDTESTLISSVNKQTQTYNKVVIPACSNCNNSILAPIEKHIFKIIQDISCKSHDLADLSNLIRWLEILDYKLQVYDCRRKYIKYEKNEYDDFFGILPVAHLRHFKDMNPYKAYDLLRSSQRRITIKKKENFKSLVIFDTLVPHFNFFTQPNEYIFISFPMIKIAAFYFLKKSFSNESDASKEALFIIKKVFQS
jgi:hypothetical protein